jgi:hypothetical protein
MMKRYGWSVIDRNKRTKGTHRSSLFTGESDEPINDVMILYGLVFLAFLVGFYLLAAKLFHIFSILNASISNKFILAQLVALGTLVGGIGLYFLREHRRMLYALLEMAFAIITGGAAISRVAGGDLSVWLALGASVYLVVRSLENMHKAGFPLIAACNNYVGRHIFARQKNTHQTGAVLAKEEHKA